MIPPDRNNTPVQSVPGINQHMITWDRYQDGRIRIALTLGVVALTVAIIALLVAIRRHSADPQRPLVCSEVAIPACPSCPSIPACPVIPPFPACPSLQRPSHAGHSHRDP